LSDTEGNRTLLVIGYGSLLSGYGILAERRGGASRLVARHAFPVLLRNARRGFAKPSSHGHYLAMDLEPVRIDQQISARVGTGSRNGEIGALGLVFDRHWAGLLARREEYGPDKFLELLAHADEAGMPLGEFLMGIARHAGFDPLAYQRALFGLLGYTSPGYIFHPVPLDDGRVAIAAIGSGYEGSGDPATRSKRREYGFDRLLTMREAIAVRNFELDHEGQIEYFIECILGGLHGIMVGDLMKGLDRSADWGRTLARRFTLACARERDLFLAATALDENRYGATFSGRPDPALEMLLNPA
jgi:hypothetical protein